MTSIRLFASTSLPRLAVPLAGGGAIALGPAARWRLVVASCRQRCPAYQAHLQRFDTLLEEFRSLGIEVVAISAAPKEEVELDQAREGWRVPLGYGLDIDVVRRLGLHFSAPPAPQQIDCPLAKPILLVISPEGEALIIDPSSTPWAGPGLASILSSLRLIQEARCLARGGCA